MRAPILRGLLPVMALMAGCTCDPFGVETTRFVCTTQSDCTEGFECRDLGQGLECVSSSATDAGTSDAGQVDAGESDADAGEVDAGEMDAGFDAGLPAEPAALRFSTAPQTILVGGCSELISVQTVDDAGVVAPVSGDTVVSLTATGGTAAFFATSNCLGTAITEVTIGANLSSVSLYATATPAGSYTLTASSPPLAPATQQLVAQNAPNTLSFITTPPDPVRGGTCLPATVEARRSGVPTPVINATNLGLTVTPTGAARFYSDAACTISTTSATLAAGSTTASFFVKPLTAGNNSIRAAANFGSGTQVIDTTGIVRRTQCNFVARTTLPDGGVNTDTNSNCYFQPPLTDLNASLLLTQATAPLSGAEVGVAEIRCRLVSPTTVACSRRQDLDPASVHVQVAEVPQGMLVQRATSSSCSAVITLPTAVNPAQSFVLKSMANSTGTFDDEDAVVAMLTSPSTVNLSVNTCGGYDVQVIDWAGVSVTRGTVDGGLPTGVLTTTVSGLPAASNDRALLLQPGTTFNGTRNVCSTLVRAAMPSASSLVLTRAAGDMSCAPVAMENLHYERIDFGDKAVVREYSATFASGDGSSPVTITPVDVTRTIVFASSQVAGGQGAGETSYGGNARFTEGVFQLVLTNANTVTVTRAQSASMAQVTFYVAELLP